MNIFKLPYGKAFVSELARLVKSFATGLAIKDHVACLERRLKTWQKGDLNELISEGRAVQHCLLWPQSPENSELLARSFA